MEAVRQALAGAISSRTSQNGSHSLQLPLHDAQPGRAGSNAYSAAETRQQNGASPPSGLPVSGFSSSGAVQNGVHASSMNGGHDDGWASSMPGQSPATAEGPASNGGSRHAQQQQLEELYLDFRPFMDRGPTTVRCVPIIR